MVVIVPCQSVCVLRQSDLDLDLDHAAADVAVAIAAAAADCCSSLKKSKRRPNTKIHGYVMCVSASNRLFDCTECFSFIQLL